MRLVLDQRVTEAGYPSLSKFADESGISLRTLQDIKRRGNGSRRIIGQIASYLKISPDNLYVFDGTDDTAATTASEDADILRMVTNSRRTEEAGDTASAMILSETAYHLEPSSVSAVFRHAEFVYKKEDYQRALELFSYGLLQVSVDDEEAVEASLENFLDCCKKTGNRKAADGFHEHYTEQYQNWRFYAKLSDYYLEIGDTTAMNECLKEAEWAKKA